MIATRFMELRRRRGLMIAMLVVNLGIPTIFLVIRLLSHAFAPKSYGPAGGYDIYTNLAAGVMYTFGFIIAATLGCTAGSVDLGEGMFRHLVVTGRSRLAIYLARIPAGLAIVVPMVASGFIVVCAVCTFAAPTTISYNGVNVPPNLTQSGFETWAGDHAGVVLCAFPYFEPETVNVPCGPNGPITTLPPKAIAKGLPNGGTQIKLPSAAKQRAEAIVVARADYSDYKTVFLYPSTSLMIKTGLWLELEATLGFLIGLGLASLLGQRTVSVVLMIVLELVLTPILTGSPIKHLINLQRSIVGLATAHIEPSALPAPLGFHGNGGGPNGMSHASLVPESITVAVCVIVAWVVVWTALGAWRMMSREA
jgi:hypothetical protein